ncbi:MAG: LPS-assembly protein LptD, partial [Proteobacteria bacterium]|nr:LPS-assembly protein LptD [Pseudomonadota bacterium]
MRCLCVKRHVVEVVALIALCMGGLVFTPSRSVAQSQQIQIEAPNSKRIFKSDSRKERKRKKTVLARAVKPELPAGDDVNIKAPQVEFEKGQNVANASGGILVSASGNRIEADAGKVNLDSKDAEVHGRVVLTAPGAQVSAESGTFNLDSEKGKFRCADLAIDEGAFKVSGANVEKLSEDRFSLNDARLTTCSCSEGDGAGSCAQKSDEPWAIHADTVRITRDGYAHVSGGRLYLGGVPVFYSPYIGFPVKEQRQSGILVPTFGYSSKDGFKAKVPLFIVADESTDFLLAPFTETKTRTGLGFDYRQSFSRYNQLNSRLLYSNESARDGDLRGTNVQGIFAPHPDYQYFDDERLAGYYKQLWRANPDLGVPLAFIADGHYVSDRLVLREMPDQDLGEETQRDVVSTAVVRAAIGEFGEAELSGEFSQPLDDRSQDYIVQRLPELRLAGQRSFRPFGYNPYGVKLVTKVNYLGDYFYRTEGYDGLRSHLVPSVGVPFHVANYLQGGVDLSYLRTDYSLDDTSVPNIATEQAVLGGYETIDSSSSRDIGILRANLGTAVERVFSVDPDSWLTTITALGAANQANRLVRVKHTIEPSVRFTYIPDVDQEGLPNFDSLGRISQRSVLSYGFRSSLYGRFLPTNRSRTAVPELTPEVTDLPVASDMSAPLGQDELFDSLGMGGAIVGRSGEVRELTRLVVRQAYDFVEADKDRNPNRNAFSDISAKLYLIPTASFALGLETNYNGEEGRVDSVG